MKVFIVHAHAEPNSFNGALTRHAQNVLTGAGHEVRITDLYAQGWDPVSDARNFTTRQNPDFFRQQNEELYAFENNGFSPDIHAEQEKLLWCDALIFQFPLWWFSMPAILKGWVDRVFAMGLVYGRGRFYDNGVFRGKRAMVSLTTGGPGTMYSEDGLHGNMDNLLFPINHGIFRFTGFDPLPAFTAYSVSRVDDAQRQQYLKDYAERLLHLETTEPLHFPSLSEFEPETFTRKVSLNS